MIGSHTGTPAAYLRQFSRVQSTSDRKPKLWTYQRGARPFASTSRHVGKEKGYFAITLSDGRRDESLEGILARFEGRSMPALRSVGNETYVLSTPDREILARYIALVFARTTARRGLSGKILSDLRNTYKELSRNPEWLRKQVLLYSRLSGISVGSEQVLQAVEKVLERLAKPENTRSGFVEGVLGIAERISREIVNKHWQVWEAPDSTEFITSDNPVVTVTADNWGRFSPGWGFRTLGVVTMFPVSPACCLIIGSTGRYWRRATVRDVKGVNQALVMCMDRWAYSASYSEDLEWLVNHLGSSVRYGENAFVRNWNDNSEYLRAKVIEVTDQAASKVVFQQPASS
jgi:Protein of unknown function (DUF4238)